MNRAGIAVVLNYIMLALAIGASALAIWDRSHDPIWDRMPDMRTTYDFISIAVIAFALAVAFGLSRRKEWGRIFGISFAAIVLYLFVGTRLLAPLMTDGNIPIRIDWDGIIMGTLSIACIVMLSIVRFGPAAREAEAHTQ